MYEFRFYDDKISKTTLVDSCLESPKMTNTPTWIHMYMDKRLFPKNLKFDWTQKRHE
jgi:hypothetical protein